MAARFGSLGNDHIGAGRRGPARFGNVASQWIGTNDTYATDTDPTGAGASGNNNMVDVQDSYYDTYAPATPSVTAGSGGSLAANTYYVQVALVISGVETARSTETFVSVSANGRLTVTAPSGIPAAAGSNVYVSTASGQEVLQNGSAVR